MSKKNRNREEVVNIDENMVNMNNEVSVEDTVTVTDEVVETPVVEEVVVEEQVPVEEVEETPVVAPVEEVKEQVAPVVEEVKEEVKPVEDVVVNRGECLLEISVLDERKGKIVRDRISDICKNVRVCGKKVVVGPIDNRDSINMIKNLLIRKGLRATVVRK